MNDMIANAGFVSVGTTCDTAEFAVQSIRSATPAEIVAVIVRSLLS